MTSKPQIGVGISTSLKLLPHIQVLTYENKEMEELFPVHFQESHEYLEGFITGNVMRTQVVEADELLKGKQQYMVGRIDDTTVAVTREGFIPGDSHHVERYWHCSDAKLTLLVPPQVIPLTCHALVPPYISRLINRHQSVKHHAHGFTLIPRYSCPCSSPCSSGFVHAVSIASSRSQGLRVFRPQHYRNLAQILRKAAHIHALHGFGTEADAQHNFGTVPLGSTPPYLAGIAGELEQTVFNSNASADIRFHRSQISWSQFLQQSFASVAAAPATSRPTVLFAALLNAKRSERLKQTAILEGMLSPKSILQKRVRNPRIRSRCPRTAEGLISASQLPRQPQRLQNLKAVAPSGTGPGGDRDAAHGHCVPAAAQELITSPRVLLGCCCCPSGEKRSQGEQPEQVFVPVNSPRRLHDACMKGNLRRGAAVAGISCHHKVTEATNHPSSPDAELLEDNTSLSTTRAATNVPTPRRRELTGTGAAALQPPCFAQVPRKVCPVLNDLTCAVVVTVRGAGSLPKPTEPEFYQGDKNVSLDRKPPQIIICRLPARAGIWSPTSDSKPQGAEQIAYFEQGKNTSWCHPRGLLWTSVTPVAPNGIPSPQPQPQPLPPEGRCLNQLPEECEGLEKPPRCQEHPFPLQHLAFRRGRSKQPPCHDSTRENVDVLHSPPLEAHTQTRLCHAAVLLETFRPLLQKQK
ncbi:hypothetical protein Anapl_12712 [Anas platyrhynchos]|uniref:Uncharacterized protein n=1 Tax=Anas platyrhynchos TaxID=8839 RepID=R0KT54_ANAPL|nr:hypothetical protein Anapl_12712 [Anas platyrhynchos]